MDDWFVEPEQTRLDVGGGQWIDVKTRLNHGERQKALAALFTATRADGALTRNLEMAGGKAELVAYLVGWSIRMHGKPVPIETEAQKVAALDALSPAKFDVLSAALTTHVAATEAADAAAKKSQDGESES